ncbi:hypothetical protein DIE19_19350 [Burkholderia sp. Bp9126]|nr:hypothetical protein DIE19_19350 [Burkholderia sp. Bp9126]
MRFRPPDDRASSGYREKGPTKRVDASQCGPLPSPPSNYLECSVNTDASCSWRSANLTAA